MQLTRITKDLLPSYRDLFKIEWPKYIISYCIFDNFINRFNKHPEWEEKVHFYKLKDDDTSDGTFALIYGSYIHVDTMEAQPYPKLEKLLYHLDISKCHMFSNIRDDFRPLIMDLMRIRRMEIIFDSGAKIVYSDVDEEYILSHRKSPPEGYFYDTLKLDDIDQILSTIPNPTSQCVEYLKTIIQYNTTTGLYRNDGLLVAWCMEHEIGGQGNVSVRPEYYRKNFGQNIVVEHALKIYRKNKPLFCEVCHHNYKSYNMVNKFKNEWLHNVSSIGFRKEPLQIYFPVWYHI